MSKKQYFITAKKDGTVVIDGGLIFCGSGFLEVEPDTTAGHRIQNNYVISECPKWWQLVKWWKVIQLIRTFAPAG